MSDNKETAAAERIKIIVEGSLLPLVERTHGMADYFAEGFHPDNLASHLASQIEVNLREIKHLVGDVLLKDGISKGNKEATA